MLGVVRLVKKLWYQVEGLRLSKLLWISQILPDVRGVLPQSQICTYICFKVRYMPPARKAGATVSATSCIPILERLH